MSEENTLSMSGEAEILSRKSWLAYVGPIGATGLGLVVAIPILVQIFSWTVAGMAGALILAYSIYHLLLLRSVKLYVDDVGVWVYSGVLPWSRGVAGVKWRDLDEAVFFQGLVAWVSRAYQPFARHQRTLASANESCRDGAIAATPMRTLADVRRRLKVVVDLGLHADPHRLRGQFQRQPVAIQESGRQSDSPVVVSGAQFVAGRWPRTTFPTSRSR
jgi:hypothetical protein